MAFVAIAWVSFITVAFCLPTANPVDSQTLNYTPVAVGILALGTFGSWFLSARKWFVGPRTGEPFAAHQFEYVLTLASPSRAEGSRRQGASSCPRRLRQRERFQRARRVARSGACDHGQRLVVIS